MKEEEIIVGGQAVIEGVMMRTPTAYAVAVRQPDGQIVSQQGPVAGLSANYPILKLPVLRGSATLIHSMALGIKALNFSANIAMTEEEQKSKKVAAEKSNATFLMILPALAFNLVIFFFLPLLLTNFIFLLARGESISISGANFAEIFGAIKFYLRPVRPSVLFNLVDGAIRMGLFLTFIAAMSRLKDIKRIFQYHGAEHKVVYNWESGLPLTVANARQQPRQHPRCGTSFLMIVMLVSIVTFSLIKFDSLLLNFGARVVLIPLVAGISYELIRFSAKCWVRKEEMTGVGRIAALLFTIMTAPGLWLQNITTQEPSDDQLEVALYALEQSLKLEKPSANEAMAAD
jgi:uncharacterized protein YqhQ